MSRQCPERALDHGLAGERRVPHLGSIQLALPLLVQGLVLIAPVPEGPHCAHIEVVLPHAG